MQQACQVGAECGAADLIERRDEGLVRHRLDHRLKRVPDEAKQRRDYETERKALVMAFDAVKPGYFDVITQDAIGYVLLILAVCLWLAGILLARKILAVQL